MSANDKSWFSQHSAELFRGSALGLLACALVALSSWEASPNPPHGVPEQQVIERYGPPDCVKERIGHKLDEGTVPVKQLIYYCGLFNTSASIIYIETEHNTVINVIQESASNI
ncbi:MAG: hypothetical protein K6G50_09240 [bacterium]|nr:hypothetical protein [bacterium]